MVNFHLPGQNRLERRWEYDLVHSGWTQAQGRPRELKEWLDRWNKDKGTRYALIDVDGVSEIAWNSTRFNPRETDNKLFFGFLIEFSQGKPRLQVVERVKTQFRLSSTYLAEAIVNYWISDTASLVFQDNGLLGISDTMLATLDQPQVFLGNLKGVVTVAEAMKRLSKDEGQIRSEFPDDPPRRLVNDKVILDLTMTDNEGMLSNLLASHGNVVSLSHLADEIGLTGLNIDEQDKLDMAVRACAAFRELHPEFDIMSEHDGFLNIGNETEVLEAHLKQREAALAEWNTYKNSIEVDTEEAIEKLNSLDMELEIAQVGLDDNQDDLSNQAMQTEFVHRVVTRLIRK